MVRTRLTEFFDIDHPIISAPMAFASGGKLAAAVTNAGGLGLIGGSYGESGFVEQALKDAGNVRTGCGFITWSLASALENAPDLLTSVLEHSPAALFLSFGNPAPYSQQIADAGVPLICQVQRLDHARHAIDCGAAVVVAQGAEAGGHGESRATMTLVPEVADMLAKAAPDVLLCAAGGIADGRGLAAALMLGADGVLVGSRLWASEEALVHPNMHRAAIASTGDDTIRSSVMDIARHLDWPGEYTARVLKNAFTNRWHNHIDGLLENAAEEAAGWKKAWAEGNMDVANTFVGEAAGMIDAVLPAGEIVAQMVSEAEQRLAAY